MNLFNKISFVLFVGISNSFSCDETVKEPPLKVLQSIDDLTPKNFPDWHNTYFQTVVIGTEKNVRTFFCLRLEELKKYLSQNPLKKSDNAEKSDNADLEFWYCVRNIHPQDVNGQEFIYKILGGIGETYGREDKEMAPDYFKIYHGKRFWPYKYTCEYTLEDSTIKHSPLEVEHVFNQFRQDQQFALNTYYEYLMQGEFLGKLAFYVYLIKEKCPLSNYFCPLLPLEDISNQLWAEFNDKMLTTFAKEEISQKREELILRIRGVLLFLSNHFISDPMVKKMGAIEKAKAISFSLTWSSNLFTALSNIVFSFQEKVAKDYVKMRLILKENQELGKDFQEAEQELLKAKETFLKSFNMLITLSKNDTFKNVDLFPHLLNLKDLLRHLEDFKDVFPSERSIFYNFLLHHHEKILKDTNEESQFLKQKLISFFGNTDQPCTYPAPASHFFKSVYEETKKESYLKKAFDWYPKKKKKDDLYKQIVHLMLDKLEQKTQLNETDYNFAISHKDYITDKNERPEKLNDWHNRHAFYLYSSKKHRESLNFYKLAASNGCALALYNCGQIYYSHLKEYPEAFNAFSLIVAEPYNDREAMCFLGLIYERYNMLDEAKIWYEKAIELGEENALLNLVDLEKKMNN